VVLTEEPEAVRRALADVGADWYKAFGHRPVVVHEPPSPSWVGPVVYLRLKGAWWKKLVKEQFPGAESFVLRAQT
jgi:hypothetical protein